jgi:hypothetical protein
MTTFFDDGYVPQVPGHRPNLRMIEAEKIWKQQLVWAHILETTDSEQERDHAVYMSKRLTQLAEAIERGDTLVEGNAPLCTCGRGLVTWAGKCEACHKEAPRPADTRQSEEYLEGRDNWLTRRGG